MTPPRRGDAAPPTLIHAVRHGETATNRAFRQADALGDAARPVPIDDLATGLTALGERQAAGFGAWLTALPAADFPDLVLCSPYLRARRTWEIAETALRAAGRPAPPLRIENGLHDRDRGELRTLTAALVRERFPDEYAAERRDPLGHRPPGGESFHDVRDRVGGVLDGASAGRVLLVAHDAVVLMLRQILEGLPDAEILAIAERGLVGNGSVTTWERAGASFRPRVLDDRRHLPG